MGKHRRFGVEFDPEHRRVLAGAVAADQAELTGELDDATDDAVQAVAELVVASFSGAMDVRYQDGSGYLIQVTKILPPTGETLIAIQPGGDIEMYQRADGAAD